MLAVGEIHTGLVQNSTALSPSQCAELLELRVGEQVLQSERPNPYAVSPEILTGIDCHLPSRTGRYVRAAGTISTRTTITGGRIVQGSSYATIIQGKRRHIWSSYLTQPGRVEAIGTLDALDLRGGFIDGKPTDTTLDIGAISGQAVDTVLGCEWFDRVPPVRAARKRLRWMALTSDVVKDGPSAVFTIKDRDMRTLALVVDNIDENDLSDILVLCEDLALHDWLLTTMISLVGTLQNSAMSIKQKAAQLLPVVEHLIHLWMPAARVSDDIVSIWRDIERHPGFSRQWNISVEWIRDQVSVGALALLQKSAPASTPTGSIARIRSDA